MYWVLSPVYQSNHVNFTEEKKVKVKLFSHVWFFATPRTVAHQTPPSMGFSRQEYWSRLPFPFPGELHNPGIEPRSPALQADALTFEFRVQWQPLLCNFCSWPLLPCFPDCNLIPSPHHNFSSLSLLLSSTHIFLVWPSPDLSVHPKPPLSHFI